MQTISLNNKQKEYHHFHCWLKILYFSLLFLLFLLFSNFKENKILFPIYPTVENSRKKPHKHKEVVLLSSTSCRASGIVLAHYAVHDCNYITTQPDDELLLLNGVYDCMYSCVSLLDSKTRTK